MKQGGPQTKHLLTANGQAEIIGSDTDDRVAKYFLY